MMLDDQYCEWYNKKFSSKLHPSRVLPVLCTLQGHPESGKLLEKHISKILCSTELNFKSTTHDHSIYKTTFKGKKVLFLRQVDDYLAQCKDEETAKEISEIMRKKLQL